MIYDQTPIEIPVEIYFKGKKCPIEIKKAEIIYQTDDVRLVRIETSRINVGFQLCNFIIKPVTCQEGFTIFPQNKKLNSLPYLLTFGLPQMKGFNVFTMNHYGRDEIHITYAKIY